MSTTRSGWRPGQVTEVRPDILLHDCSTVGGNSGSVLVDLATGEAIGLHFAGRFLEANYAVPATVVAARLERLRRRPGSPGAAVAGPAAPAAATPAPAPPGTQTTVPGGTLPGSEPMLEGVPADYVGRGGYDRRFLGVTVPLPAMRECERRADVPVEWRDRTRAAVPAFLRGDVAAAAGSVSSARSTSTARARGGSSGRPGAWIRGFLPPSRSERSATATSRCSAAAT